MLMNALTSDLVVGNPTCRRVSFTRFVLPFAWEAIKPGSRKTPDGPFFRSAEKTDWIHAANRSEEDGPQFLDRSRRRYLTRETERLLYERASWLVLEDPRKEDEAIWRRFDVASYLETPAYTVALRPPALVLFEWPQKALLELGEDPLRIGFLIHEAFFPDPDKAPIPADLLRFNEIFRYWRSPFPEFHNTFCKPELESISHGIAVGHPALMGNGNEESEARLFNQWVDLLSHPAQDDEGMLRIVKPVDAPEDSEIFPRWMVNPDDRAFTLPFAVLGGKGWASKRRFTPFQFGEAKRESGQGGFWVKLLNVDRVSSRDPETISCSTHFEEKWARDRTYTRWSEGDSPTLYGFCEHSFAILCTPDGAGHGEPPLVKHMGQIYFDTTLLHLYVRVALFRFSALLHEITSSARDNQTGRLDEIKEWRKPFHELRWHFLQFQNLYRFPLFSNQQQHLEMYELQSRFMDVEKLYQEVEKEIDASDEFLENELARERNRMASLLNVVASLGLVAALALGWMDATSDSIRGNAVAWFLGLNFLFFLALIGVLGASSWIEAGMRWIASSLTWNRTRKPPSPRAEGREPDLMNRECKALSDHFDSAPHYIRSTCPPLCVTLFAFFLFLLSIVLLTYLSRDDSRASKPPPSPEKTLSLPTDDSL